jgi:hypothetical protein
MPRQPSDELRRFVQRRARLNDKLEEAKARIDVWVNEHETGEASSTELAYLEGLLEARRDLLRELLALDDSFMEYLLDLLGRELTREG